MKTKRDLVVPHSASLGTWYRAVRPKSFSATFAPIAVGLALALLDGRFELLWAVLTLVAALLLQAGANLTNDYFDHQNGVDSSASLSPSGVIQQGLLAPRTVLIGALACFALGAGLGILCALRGGPLIWGLGLLGLLIAFFYTAGPLPLAYVGLGELVVFVAMGPAMVLGAYAVQTQQFSWLALAAGVPVGLLVAAILHANNLRDIETDRAEGKRTLAARFGRAFARREFAALVIGAYLAVAALLVVDAPLALAGLALLPTLPQAGLLVREAFAAEEPARLNRVLRGTAVLHGRFGVLWAVGIMAVSGLQGL
jgi:1,4-dihydroxy-2-naphthoate octaprenyltransferase